MAQVRLLSNYCKEEITKEDNKFAIICYLKAKEEGERGYRKRMHQYWKEDGRFEIKEQHQVCQVRSILKTKKLSEVEMDALRRKVLTLQETVEVLIENDPVEGSDVTPVIVIGVEQNHPAAEGGMEGADELHQHYFTQRIRTMQENSCNPMPSLRGI